MTGPRIAVARTAAVLAGVCVAVHLAMVVVMPSFLALPMVVLAVLCAMCGRHLWQRSEPKFWAGMVAGTLTMLALHAFVLNAPTAPIASSAHHASTPIGLSLTWLDHDDLLIVASVAAVGELLLAAVALLRGISRRYAARAPLPPLRTAPTTEIGRS